MWPFVACKKYYIQRSFGIYCPIIMRMIVRLNRSFKIKNLQSIRVTQWRARSTINYGVLYIIVPITMEQSLLYRQPTRHLLPPNLYLYRVRASRLWWIISSNHWPKNSTYYRITKMGSCDKAIVNLLKIIAKHPF